MKNYEHIKNFIDKKDFKGLAKFLYEENIKFCDGSSEMCEIKYQGDNACKECQINELSEWLEDKPCIDYKEELHNLIKITDIEADAKNILKDLYSCDGFNSEISGICIKIPNELVNRILKLLNDIQDTEKDKAINNELKYDAKYVKQIITAMQNPDFDFVLLKKQDIEKLITFFIASEGS